MDGRKERERGRERKKERKKEPTNLEDDRIQAQVGTGFQGSQVGIVRYIHALGLWGGEAKPSSLCLSQKES